MVGAGQALRNTARGMAQASAVGYDVSMSTLVAPSPFAAELRRWRNARRFSQLELALRTDTTQRHLSFMEQGRSRPGR